MNWCNGLKVKVRKSVPLKGLTTFKIGGPADFLAEPRDEADLKLLLNQAKQYKIPILVMGSGSNLLVSDKGVRALVIRLCAPNFRRIKFQGNYLSAGAGCALGQLLQAARARNLAGLEFLAGIPGTLGGALAMNAGAWGRAIGDQVVSCRLMDYRGRISRVPGRARLFGYRKSGLAKSIIIEAKLRLAKAPGKEISGRIKSYLARRAKTQDLSLPSAGCVFKNPVGDSAGRLIDICGFKGKKIGGAGISGCHANFMVNLGGAKSGEVIRLMELVKKRVQQKAKVILEPEIKLWPCRPAVRRPAVRRPAVRRPAVRRPAVQEEKGEF